MAGFPGLRRTEARTLPERLGTFVEVASNNACNLSCVYCYGLGHPPPMRMTETGYAGLLDELLPRTSILVPSAGSEPFSAHLDIATRKVVEHGRRMLLITNGTFPMASTVQTLGKHLYRLQVSVDSHLEETYERMRPGAKFRNVLANLREAIGVLRGMDLLHRLVVSIVLTRDTAHSVAGTIRFFREEGVEAFLVQELYRLDPRLDAYQPDHPSIEQLRSQCPAVARETLSDILFAHPPVQRFNGRAETAPPVEWDPENIRARMAEKPGQCWQAWEWLKIHPGGNVHPCCVAPPELELGNLSRKTLAEILAGGGRERLQAAFENGNPPSVCRTCPLLGQIARPLEVVT